LPAFTPDQLRAALMQTMQGQADPEAAVSKESGAGVGPYAALFGGEAADIGTTVAAKARGGKESNPLLGDFGPAAIAAKLGTAGAMALAMRYLASHGHPGLAKALGYGSGAALGAVAAHNSQVGKK
jgi:hypothetical protein